MISPMISLAFSPRKISGLFPLRIDITPDITRGVPNEQKRTDASLHLAVFYTKHTRDKVNHLLAGGDLRAGEGDGEQMKSR